MCGIAGLVYLDGAPVSPVTLKSMSDVIEHRGPDGEGQWIEGNVGIAHRRLSIIDLSPAGKQPMVSADHRYVLSYNGEVYNFKELRSELEAEGYWFRSQTDSEVVLNALVAWGVDAAINRFNGMFAFALWDRRTKQLVLGRDRYGIKPIYYAVQDRIFAFGSEQKVFNCIPEFKKRLNKSGLMEYFTFQNFFTSQTLNEDVHMLPAGSYATLDVGKKYATPSVKQYWDYQFSDSNEFKSEQEYVEELDRLFTQAVNRQLVSDVELGCYLSGGMDSGSISAVASRSFSNLKTFTCGFDLSSASGIELGFDERVKAEAMSAYFKTEHYEMVLKAGDMERALPALAKSLEEPRVGQSYPNFYAAKLASKFVKVVMSGAGGDEMFAGYPWRYFRAAICNDFDHYIDQYYQFWHRLIPDSKIDGIFNPIWNDVKDISTRQIFKDVFAGHENPLERPEDYINHSLYFEAKTFLHGLLTVEDKLSMAHSLETRVPFLDNDLVDFAMKCPVRYKFRNLKEFVEINENDLGSNREKYFSKTRDGKQILRDVMRQHIPEDVANAVKQGFSAPDASWFKGESIDYVKRRLLNPNANNYKVLDYENTTALINEHLEGKENRRLLIWSLLNMEQCLEEFND